MGKGWNLAGFSSIGRTNPTLFHNNEIDNVDFDGDQLMLDGNRLIEVGRENGKTIFRTELDEFSKVVYHPAGQHGDYFTVYTKNGLIKEYGNSSDSRQYYDGCADAEESPLFWHLTKIYDRQHNSVKYFYDQIPDKGSLLPARIEYTHFEVEELDDFSYTIAFRYDDLSETTMAQTFLFEKDGMPYKNINDSRLEGIDIYYKDDPEQMVRSYQLKYANESSVAGEFFLESVGYTSYDAHTGSSGQYKPTQFNWNIYEPARIKHPTEFIHDDIDSLFDHHQYLVIPIDIDGDGKQEVVDYKVYTGESGGDGIPTVTVYTFGPKNEIEITQGLSRVKHLVAVDLDNDAGDELIIGLKNKLLVYDFRKVGNQWISILKKQIETGILYPKPIIADYSGDGRPDLLVVYEISGEANLYLGNGVEPEYFDASYYNFNDFNPNDDLQNINASADFNGDGKSEFVLEIRENVYGTTGTLEKIKFEIVPYAFIQGEFLPQLGAQTLLNEHPEDKKDNIYYADLNGDGRFDIHHQIVPKHNVYGEEFNTTYFSFGKGFLSSAPRITYHRENTPQLLLADMNNDARADWIYVEIGRDAVFYQGQFLQTTTHFAQPDGSPGPARILKTYITNAANYAGEMAAFTIADLTANGISDLAAVFYKRSPDQKIPQKKVYTIVAIQDSVDLASDVVTKITNGLGVDQVVKYQSTSSSLTYQDDVEYPLGKLKIKTWVVEETFIPDENGNKLDHYSYDFRKPVIMHTGKGFLGFLEHLVFDKVKNLKTTVSNEIISADFEDGTFGYDLLPTKSSTKTTGERDLLLSETTRKYDLKFPLTDNNLIHFPVATEVITKTWDNDPEHSFIRTLKQKQEPGEIDTYGNSIKNTVLIDSGEPASDAMFEFRTTTQASFEHLIDVSNWLIGRPESVVVTVEQSGEKPDKKETQFQYQQNTLLVDKKTIIPNDNDTLTYHWIYEYGKYGNIISVIQDPGKFEYNGKKFDQRKTAFEYTDDTELLGRFLTATVDESNGITFKTESIYDRFTGNVTRSTGADQLKTHYDYDEMGRLVALSHPAG